MVDLCGSQIHTLCVFLTRSQRSCLLSSVPHVGLCLVSPLTSYRCLSLYLKHICCVVSLSSALFFLNKGV